MRDLARVRVTRGERRCITRVRAGGVRSKRGLFPARGRAVASGIGRRRRRRVDVCRRSRVRRRVGPDRRRPPPARLGGSQRARVCVRVRVVRVRRGRRGGPPRRREEVPGDRRGGGCAHGLVRDARRGTAGSRSIGARGLLRDGDACFSRNRTADASARGRSARGALVSRGVAGHAELELTRDARARARRGRRADPGVSGGNRRPRFFPRRAQTPPLRPVRLVAARPASARLQAVALRGSRKRSLGRRRGVFRCASREHGG